MKSTKEFVAGKNGISWAGSNFKERLYDIEFEKASVEGLDTRTLPRYMNDAAIAKEFAPEPVLLGDVLAYLKQASHSGWYIFYVNDLEGTLWAVDADWSGDGWDVEASPVANPGVWFGGSVVVSRCFSDTQNKTLGTLEFQSLKTRLAKVEAILKFHNLTNPSE